MRIVHFTLVLACVLMPVFAQETANGPADEKAQKTYTGALQHLHEGDTLWAFDDFKKADKQDGGHCLACQKQMIKYGSELGDWKTAEFAAGEMVAEAQGSQDTAMAHYLFAVLLMSEGSLNHKSQFFTRASDEAGKALAAYSNFPDAIFLEGKALANLQQDDAAIAKFEQFVKLEPEGNPDRRRALRYISRPELARARMAPPFAVTTVDGQRVSLDDLQGKVVLIDFWATWCQPCREALPHMKEIAKKFQGQPLVILSVSLDSDEQQWKDFITKNEMTWLQYRDGSFSGSIAKMFGVQAIPHTFTIDADGVLQDERVGDAAIEGRLKKLIANARELQSPGASTNSGGGAPGL